MNFSPSVSYFAVWIFQMCVEACLIFGVWRRRGYPMFLTYISFHLFWSLCLFPLAISNQMKVYFYFYWWGRALLLSLECAAIGAVLSRILAPLTSISTRMTSTAVIIGSLLCGLGWVISANLKSKPLLPITRFVLSAERGLITMEAVAILFCIVMMSAFAFRWSPTDAFITAGFVLQALSVMISSALFSSVPIRYTDLIQNGLQVADLLTFGLWIAAFYPIIKIYSQCRVGIQCRSVR